MKFLSAIIIPLVLNSGCGNGGSHDAREDSSESGQIRGSGASGDAKQSGSSRSTPKLDTDDAYASFEEASPSNSDRKSSNDRRGLTNNESGPSSSYHSAMDVTTSRSADGSVDTGARKGADMKTIQALADRQKFSDESDASG